MDIKKILNIKVVKADDMEEGFAAFVAGREEHEDPTILFNVSATLNCSIENNINFKEFLIWSMMHEFGHCLEEAFEKDFDEQFIERVVESYRSRYGKK